MCRSEQRAHGRQWDDVGIATLIHSLTRSLHVSIHCPRCPSRPVLSARRGGTGIHQPVRGHHAHFAKLDRQQHKAGYGVAFGGFGRIVGGETEIAFYPEVIDNSANGLTKSKVISFSAGMLIGPTVGPAKPYFAFGAGNLNLNVTGISSIAVPNPESISNNYFTFNAGGGVMGYFSDHLGVRGDLRYFRAFGIKLEDLEDAGLSFDKFNFWRASFGLVVKF